MTELKHLSLYRKYRPSNFSEVVGQDHIVKLLARSIQSGSFPHAYLFSGSRGLGKTSIARIFAREIGTDASDIHEIDAASNRGIDDIRQLKEEVNVLPLMSKYKVYIIDEVHMLTRDAFNALLKTLEEPPRHVLFILATTELEKVLDTVISRCEVHQFKKPSIPLLETTLIGIAQKENVTLEAGAAHVLALLSEGSYRDALGNLQKALSIEKDGKVEALDVEAIFSLPSRSIILSLLKAFHEGNPGGVFTTLTQAEERNIDFELLYELLLEDMRSILLLRYLPESEQKLKEIVTEEVFQELALLSKESLKTINSKTLSLLLSAGRDIRTSSHPRLALELALLQALEA